MRYLLQKNYQSEFSSRKDYLYDIFKLWFIQTGEEQDFIVYTSIPSHSYSDFLFIVGHNFPVKFLLLDTYISEKNIVAITCDGGCNFKKLRMIDKNLYLPFQNRDNLVDLLSGTKFGFNFDLTESELMLYNSPANLSLEKRIEMSFQLINIYRRKT